MEKNEQIKVAESKVDGKVSNAQTEKCIDIEIKQQCANNSKTPLTPYQKYKQSRNQNGKKYFEFYDDIKVYTHNVYDW
ncbi:MAG: hypothetical protein IJ358_04385 [Clostridia bacterium]|nr:hypothetical protein [Clostridia bacterium]